AAAQRGFGGNRGGRDIGGRFRSGRGRHARVGGARAAGVPHAGALARASTDAGRACARARYCAPRLVVASFLSGIESGGMHDLQYTAIGFVVGALVGMTGVGGGSLTTPLLIVLFGVAPATAVGTDLLFAAVTKTAGSLVHGYNHTIDWRLVRRLASGSVPGTMLTLLTLSHLDMASGGARMIISVFLTIALLLTAGVLVARPKIVELYSRHVGELTERAAAIATVCVGAALGVVVTISSVGAGALGVTALVLLYPRLPTVRIVGSDIAHAVPLT